MQTKTSEDRRLFKSQSGK